MTLRACPQCGYRYNAPENQTCGKCKGWLGAPGTTASAAVAQPRRSLAPGRLRGFAGIRPSPLGALSGWPTPSGAGSGLLLAARWSKFVALGSDGFSKGLLLGLLT